MLEASPHDQTAFFGPAPSHHLGRRGGGHEPPGGAARFGVAPSTVIDLVRQWKATGSCEARAQGGDRRSARIEAHAAQLLGLIDTTPDISLVEIAETRGMLLPDGTKHDGVWRAEDVGNAIKKDRVDLFIGHPSNARILRDVGIGHLTALAVKVLELPTKESCVYREPAGR